MWFLINPGGKNPKKQKQYQGEGDEDETWKDETWKSKETVSALRLKSFRQKPKLHFYSFLTDNLTKDEVKITLNICEILCAPWGNKGIHKWNTVSAG